MAEQVELTDLEVISRWSLAVRAASADRDELIAALEADLQWLRGARRTPASAAPSPAAAPQAAAKRVAAPPAAAKPVAASQAPAKRAAAPGKGAAPPKGAAKKVPARGAARRDR